MCCQFLNLSPSFHWFQWLSMKCKNNPLSSKTFWELIVRRSKDCCWKDKRYTKDKTKMFTFSTWGSLLDRWRFLFSFVVVVLTHFSCFLFGQDFTRFPINLSTHATSKRNNTKTIKFTLFRFGQFFFHLGFRCKTQSCSSVKWWYSLPEMTDYTTRCPGSKCLSI